MKRRSDVTDTVKAEIQLMNLLEGKRPSSGVISLKELGLNMWPCNVYFFGDSELCEMMLFFQVSRIFIEVALFLVLQELGNTRQFQVNLVLENCRVCADGKLRDDRCKITFAVASWRPIHSRQVVCIRVYCRIRVH